MTNTSIAVPNSRWWPGKTSAIISAVLATLAAPFLVFAAWTFVDAVASTPCDQSAHSGESDYCEDAALGNGIAFVAGSAFAGIGGLLMIGAAGLFLRPGVRARVIWSIVILIVAYPFAILISQLR